MLTAAAALQFDQVGLSYGRRPALSAVSFTVAAGRLCALCGPNGAGKSSTLRLICGLLRPSTGAGQVLGEALSARPARRRAQIGYMAQHTVLYDELSVRENLRFRAAVMGLDDARSRAEQALQGWGLHTVAGQRVGALSGGWRQRLAFASAQLANPRLLLLDEPSAGLDAEARAELWGRLRALAAAGATIVVSSHDPAEAALCDQLLVLAAGRLTYSGAPGGYWSPAQLEALRAAARIGMGGAGEVGA